MTKRLSYEELETRVRQLEESLELIGDSNDSLNTIAARYENTIRHISDFVFAHDLEGNFVETDMPDMKSINKSTGYSSEDLTGQNIEDFIPERFKSEFKGYMARLDRNGKDEGPMIFKTKNMDERYIWYSNSLMEDSGEKIVRGIARDITDSIHTKRLIKESQKLLTQVVESSSIPTFVIDEKHEIIFWNHACEILTGILASEVTGTSDQWKAFYPNHQPTLADLVVKQASKNEFRSQFGNKYYPSRNIPGAYQCEKYFDTLGGSKGKWLFFTAAPLKNNQGEITGAIETLQDITGRKQAENGLAKAHKDLEKKVKQRTQSLLETNTALKVLLKKRDDDKKDLEGKMLFNVRELVMPYINKLKESRLKEKQQVYLEIIESNLNEIISPFIQGMSFEMLKLTPSEIQIANLIKQGKGSKEIATTLNLSPRTIDFHRDNIRKKFNINGKKINLRTYLLSNE